MSRKKNIFNWNHISEKLNENQIEELKSYYITYHRKCFKKWKLLGDTLSVAFATGGIASAIATSGISLVAISTTSVIIQGWMKHKNLDLKIQTRWGFLMRFRPHICPQFFLVAILAASEVWE